MEQLGEIGVGAGTSLATSLLTRTKKHIRYLTKYNENLSILKAKAAQLDAKRTDAKRLFDETKSKLKDVNSSTTLWKTEADELHELFQNIFPTKRVSRLNLWSRYLISKHACELTQRINGKVYEAQDFGTTFDRPPPKLGDKFNLRGFMEFKSRETVLNGVLEALRDDEVSMCSMCAMGGTGKTLLAKKLVQKVEADRLFDKVAMVTVSQDVKLDAIQKDIIEQLGLKMDEETSTARANKLNAWFNINNTLLILDDIWYQLSDEDFEKVGIPLGSKRCKIVLTSRNEDECKKMGSQRNFLVGVLEQEEAWNLFQRNAGASVEELNLGDIARKIANECDGLPIAIVTIATALKDKPRGVWKDSLRQLRNSNLRSISGMDKVYSRIQLSYDLLKEKEAQACFRLCCLFPEDSDVYAEDLVFYGKGLELFENVDTISETRDRVEAIIHTLKKSFLLLDGEKIGCAKMHDVMRSFAMSITPDPYLVKHDYETTKWPETCKFKDYSAISLTLDGVEEHPADLRFSKLKLLKLSLGDDSTELPVGFFEGMKQLKVLHLEVQSLLPPLGALKELRTLFIHEIRLLKESEAPEIEDLFGHGDLNNLESLVLSSFRPFYNFPQKIGLLRNLRFLEFRTMPFVYMPPGILSKLVKLEELLLPCQFISWGRKEEDGERFNASLDEIELLPLTRSMIGMHECSSLGDEFVENLKRFEISIGICKDAYQFFNDEISSSTSLNINDVDISLVTMNLIISLLKRSERLKLSNVRNLKNLKRLPLSHKLKEMEVFSCVEMEFFVSTTMGAACFNNLSDLIIWGCSKLKYVFHLSVARELRLLQRMNIRCCNEMEEIFLRSDGNQKAKENVPIDHDDDDATEYETILPQLTNLVLDSNDKLRVIYGGNEAIELPSLEEIEINYCHNVEAFCYGSLHAPKVTLGKEGVKDLNATLKKWKLVHEKLHSDEEIEEDEHYNNEEKEDDKLDNDSEIEEDED